MIKMFFDITSDEFKNYICIDYRKWIIQSLEIKLQKKNVFTYPILELILMTFSKENIHYLNFVIKIFYNFQQKSQNDILQEKISNYFKW